MVVRCLSFLLVLGPLVHASEWYHFMANESVCLFFTKGSSVEIGMQSYRLHGTEEPIPDEVEITFFDATLAHFEHYTKEELDQNASMNKAIVMDEDGWGVQVDTADYEPEVFTLSSGHRHYLQNITRTGKYCYLTRVHAEKNVTGNELLYFSSGVYVNSTNSSLHRSEIIDIIAFIALAFYFLIVSLIVWYWSLPRIIFWRELASFFFCLIFLLQKVRRRSSIVPEAMQSCFNVSMLAFYFKPDNIFTPLILGLSLLQATLFVEEKYPRVCQIDIVIFAVFLMVNFLFVKKAWDKRSKLGVLVQLERIWIIIERFFAPHTFKVIMRFLCQSSFYKNYVLYDETFSINGFSIEYQTYSVLLKLLVIGGGLYCAKPLGSSHTKRNKRASNGQVLLMFAICAASVFLLAGTFFPVLRRHECVRYDYFSPNGYLPADFFIPQANLFEKGFRYAQSYF
jgi:hypothetical protein